MRRLLLFLLMASAALAQDFSLTEGGQQHYFLWTGPTRAHLLLRPQSRVIFAFPAENSGIGLWLGAGSRLESVGPPVAVESKSGSAVCWRLRSTTARLVVTDEVLGSIRSLRDRQTGGVEAAHREEAARRRLARARPDWVSWRQRVQGRSLEARRASWKDGDYRLTVQVAEGVKLETREEGWTASAAGPFELEITAEVPYRSPAANTAEELFSPAARELLKAEPDNARLQAAARGLLFLAPKDKFMAGSWRFLTYFGRDTMLSLMMLHPALTPESYARGLESVLKRLAPDGEVAHEEDLGDWAVYDRLQKGEQGGLFQPVYDYKMVDDDYMLAPAVALQPDFLARHQRAVNRNFDFVVRSARAFAARPQARNLIAIHQDQQVGDWRDSNEGLGHGRYPSSVNAELVGAALRAIQKLEPERRLESEIAAWDRARDLFRVHLGPAEIRRRLKRYMEASMSMEERRFYRSRQVGEGGPPLGDFLDGRTLPPALAHGLTFQALSLDAHGRPVPVMCTDMAFGLFLGQAPRRDVDDFLTLLELEYPLGLRTGVGPVVANPAYSPDPRHWKELGRKAYHGVVVWSWQAAMIELGLAHQANPRAQKVLKILLEADKAAGALASSELWAVVPGPKDWRATAWTSSHSDESNPVQLWSTVYPALLLELSHQQ